MFPGPARGNRSDTLKLSAALKLGAAVKVSFGASRRQGETEASRRQGIRGKERGVRVMVRFRGRVLGVLGCCLPFRGRGRRF